VLFMEGEGEPTEIIRLRRDLRAAADGSLAAGEWLTSAMQASWDAAAALLDIAELADMLGEPHRIIVNDWQAAHMSTLAGRMLLRATEVLDHVDFTPGGLRKDLAGDAAAPARLYAAAELIARAADLLSDPPGWSMRMSAGGACSAPGSCSSLTRTALPPAPTASRGDGWPAGAGTAAPAWCSVAAVPWPWGPAAAGPKALPGYLSAW
jgi:hypothetical protein